MPSQPHVVHLVPALFDADDGVIGGAERYVLELARHMADAVPTRLVTFGSRNRHERLGRLDIHVIGDPRLVRGQRANPIAWGLFREIRHAAVVHCHQQHVVASSLAAAYCRTARRAVFCTDLGGGGWDVSAYVSTDRWFHGHLHISEYSRKIAGHDCASWAHVVYGGVDARKFSPGEHARHDGPVLYVGRLLPHKGLNDLLDALDPDVECEIIGPAPDPAYREALAARAAGKSVRFRSDCDDDALVEAYRRASCVVLPSVYRDCYGNETQVPELLGQTLLEGMASAAPCVCTAVASLPEVVVDGLTGYVVPPNDPQSLRTAINRLLTDRSAARRMGEEGRRRALDKFSWPEVVSRCLRAYRTAATARNVGHPSLLPNDTCVDV